MSIWPKYDSATGKCFTQGSDSYNQQDMDRISREEAKFAAIPPGGMDLEADPANDPNFGDYNIPPGGNHP